MTVSIVYSRAQHGINAPLVCIEVHIASGLPAFNIVGLPEKAVRESRDRVRSALVYNQYALSTGRITINLSPADLPKEGGQYDLPIAIGLLAAQGDIVQEQLEGVELVGELGLTGEVRKIQGVLPMALAAREANRTLILPRQNEQEALRVDGLGLHGIEHLNEVVQHLVGVKLLPLAQPSHNPLGVHHPYDFAEVRGQPLAKRALEIAAAGGHSVLMQGSPGAGKSMLAQRFITLLPPLPVDQALETAAVYSVSSISERQSHWQRPPFRSPHHTASYVAVVGGGSEVLPGEISLAHNGVLFLDELPEFSKSVLESLREPMEMGCVHISRANKHVEYPANFQLLAAMNPCPCGFFLDIDKVCRCTPDQITRYQNRLSGPLLDRIDLRLEMQRMELSVLLMNAKVEESSEQVRARVLQARQLQFERQGKINSRLGVKEMNTVLKAIPQLQQYILKVATQLTLSARGFYRLVKVARTIADLDQRSGILKRDIDESLVFRMFV